jgi:hypothetical protein
VLKRNRTLKVLNLSDNKIEAPGLTALAEALVSLTSIVRVGADARNTIHVWRRLTLVLILVVGLALKEYVLFLKGK